MGCVAYVDETKSWMNDMAHMDEVNKELIKDENHLARLGARLRDSNKGGIYVQNRVKSLVVVDAKEK